MKGLKKLFAASLAVVMLVSTINITATTASAKIKFIYGKKLVLNIGESDSIVVKGKGTKYKTSNKKVATVSKKGDVKAKGAGQCKITITQGKQKATATVTVTPAKVKDPQLSTANWRATTSAAATVTLSASWSPVKGASGYNVYYSTNSSSGFKKKSVAGKSTTSTTIPGLAYGNTYYVKVKAYTKAGSKKVESKEFSATQKVKTYFYKMTWNDEFSGTKLDSTKWNNSGATGAGGYGNNELQNYQMDYCEVKDGNLIIKPQIQWDKSKNAYVKNSAYSTKLWTRKQKSFQYGKFEFRTKLPKGQGTWAACWMLGDNNGWPMCGEIDVLETTSAPLKQSIPQTIHCQKFNGMPSSTGPKHKEAIVPTATSEYHTYGIEWTEEVITFFVDGKKTWEYNPAIYTGGTGNNDVWPYKQPFYLILNCAIGGTLGGSPNPNYWTKIATNGNIETYQDKMYIDYVRVYQ